MIRVQNLKPYAIDSPSTLAPGEIAEVEESEDVERLIAAGIIAEVAESEKEQETEADEKPSSSNRRKKA